MSFKEISTEDLQKVIAELGNEFATRDVSENHRLRDAYPDLAQSSHYHALIGRAISENRGHLGLEAVPKKTARGSIWRKRKIRDSKFRRRMRRHQSWYREEILGSPCGVGPRKNSEQLLGNMLTPEAGKSGKNFLNDEIHQVAKDRLAEGGSGVEAYRLLHNMLSSQPMCFNLFGPLVRDLKLATTLWRQLLGDQVAKVEMVAIEWAPKPPAEYLDDKTAFDAFVEYRRPDGKLAFIGIETKLAEPFSPTKHDRPQYRNLMTPESPWLLDSKSREGLLANNQLWRNHLLAVAMLRHPQSEYASGQVMLVRHPEDDPCQKRVTRYRKFLRSGDDSFIDQPLDELVSQWQSAVPEHARSWLESFRLRYLELSRSEEN